MKHDEKKIEELNKNLKRYKDPTQLNGTDYYLIPIQKVEHDRKQYAEHMVQQERERMVNALPEVNYTRDMKSTYRNEMREEIINLINKEDE